MDRTVKPKLVVVGNGMAGMRTVEELLKLDADMYDITVFGAEPRVNYNRIMLSPVLAGEKKLDDIILHSRAWYAENGIVLHAGDPVVAIDRARRIVRARSGLETAYDRLLLATGSSPFIVPVPGAHDIIGDRAYAQDPATVTQLGRAAAEGLLAGGVLPIIKHIPGHGRAFSDSHHDLPVVETAIEELDAWDFAPFKALSDMPMAMTAHVVFTAVDAKRPATTSKKAIRLMRERLGFSGLILSDDLSMQALSGTLTERAERSLKAGCDVVLHCNGDLKEMAAVADGTKKLKGEAKRRAEAALNRIVRAPEPLDVAEARARLEAALTGRFDAAKGPDVGEAQA